MPATRRGRSGRPVSLASQIAGDAGHFAVLIHGLGYGRTGWGPFAELLARRRRVVLVDNRGIGGSDAPAGPYRVEEMAGDVAGLLDELDLDGCDLIGASLGGMVALRLALDSPTRFRKIVLVATTPGAELGAPLPKATERLLRRGPPTGPDAERRAVAGALSPATLAERPELVDILLELARRDPQPRAAWRAQAAASASFCLQSDGLERLVNPVLAVAGLDDTVIDPQNSELLARLLPNARAELLAGAGHLCFWERPEKLAELVGGFLDGEGRSGEQERSGAGR